MFTIVLLSLKTLSTIKFASNPYVRVSNIYTPPNIFLKNIREWINFTSTAADEIGASEWVCLIVPPVGKSYRT